MYFNSIHFRYSILFNTMKFTEKYLSFTIIRNEANFFNSETGTLYCEPIFYDFKIPKDNLNDFTSIILKRITCDSKFYLSHDNKSKYYFDSRCKSVFEIVDNGNNEINVIFYNPYKIVYTVKLSELPYTYYYSILQYYISDSDTLTDIIKEFKSSHNILIYKLQKKPKEDFIFPRYVNLETYQKMLIERLNEVVERNKIKYGITKTFDIKFIKPNNFFPNWTAKYFSMFHDYPAYKKPKNDIKF